MATVLSPRDGKGQTLDVRTGATKASNPKAPVLPAIPPRLWCTSVHTMGVDCEWDPAKAKANITKHGVHLADAVGALEDNSVLTIRDPYSEEEERWITVGMDAVGRL